MLVSTYGSAGRSAYLESLARSCATSAASPAAADASSGGGSRAEGGGAAGDGQARCGWCAAVCAARSFTATGGVGTPVRMATGRTRRAPDASANLSPENGSGDAARAGCRVSGVGDATGVAGQAGEKAAERTVGDRPPKARLGGAAGVGLPRASGGDP